MAKYPELWRARLRDARVRNEEYHAAKLAARIEKERQWFKRRGHEIISIGIPVWGATATWRICKWCRRSSTELWRREVRRTRTPYCVPIKTEDQVEGTKLIPTMFTWKRWLKNRNKDHMGLIQEKMGMDEAEVNLRARLALTMGAQSMTADAIWHRERKARLVRLGLKKVGRRRTRVQKREGSKRDCQARVAGS